MSGVALGGGIGYLRGRYGLTCDNLVAARIVTADGTCLVVNEQENADLLWSLGVAVNRVASDATAFAVRDAKYVLLVDAMAMNGEDEACQVWLRDLEQALHTVSNGTPYINGIVADDTVVARVYRQNKDKLIDIKTKYDPQNTFRFNHNLVPKA